MKNDDNSKTKAVSQPGKGDMEVFTHMGVGSEAGL